MRPVSLFESGHSTGEGRSVGQAAKGSELARDVGGADGPIAKETLAEYLDALERVHLLEDSGAWRPHMRSRARLPTGPLRYFVDPSLGPAALNIGSADLIADPRALGFHFEALAIRDLRAYVVPLRGVVDSWRDSNGNEVDAIITTRDGWGAFEIKLNPAAVDAATAALRRFAANIDITVHGEPKVLGVVTSTGYAGPWYGPTDSGTSPRRCEEDAAGVNNRRVTVLSDHETYRCHPPVGLVCQSGEIDSGVGLGPVLA